MRQQGLRIRCVCAGHGDCPDQLFAESCRIGRLTKVRAQHRKLISAEAGDGIRLAYGGPEAPGDGEKEFIADHVAERIVRVLEMVKVEE
jgi:hypothetical protein